MSRTLSNRVYIVTGGAGAIGHAIGQAILQQGGRVVLCDIDADKVTGHARTLAANGDACVALACDVTSTDDARAAVDAAIATFGQLDGLVNNAGLIRMNAAWDATAEEWQAHFAVNATGAFLMSQAAAIQLKKAGGSIVNIASNCGKVGYRNMAAYNASKAAVISLTRSLAMEWAEHQINVNAICPGGVDTQMLGAVADWLSPRLDTPAGELLEGMGAEQLGRRIQPEEVAAVVTFLLSDDAQIIRGQAISVDGGDTPY